MLNKLIKKYLKTEESIIDNIPSISIHYPKDIKKLSINQFIKIQNYLGDYLFFHISLPENIDNISNYGLTTKKVYAGASNLKNIEDYIYWKNFYHGIYLSSSSRCQIITTIRMISDIFNTNELLLFGINLNKSETKSLLLDEDSIDIIITHYLFYFTLWFLKDNNINTKNIITNIENILFKEDLYKILNKYIDNHDFLYKLAYYFNIHFQLNIKISHLNELKYIFKYYIIIKNLFRNNNIDKSKYLNTIITFRDYWIKLLTILNPKISSNVISKIIYLINGPSTFIDINNYSVPDYKEDFQNWKKIKNNNLFKSTVDELILRPKYNKIYNCANLLKYWFKSEIKSKENIEWIYYWLIIESQRYVYLDNILPNRLKLICKINIKN